MARELLDSMTIQITSGKIETSEAALVAHEFIDEADAFEELRPVNRRNEPQARNYIADADIDRALSMMIAVDDFVGVGIALRQLPIQP